MLPRHMGRRLQPGRAKLQPGEQGAGTMMCAALGIAGCASVAAIGLPGQVCRGLERHGCRSRCTHRQARGPAWHFSALRVLASHESFGMTCIGS